jgi:hypothetical protein
MSLFGISHIIPEDQPGQDGAQMLAPVLTGVGACITMISLMNRPSGCRIGCCRRKAKARIGPAESIDAAERPPSPVPAWPAAFDEEEQHSRVSTPAAVGTSPSVVDSLRMAADESMNTQAGKSSPAAPQAVITPNNLQQAPRGSRSAAKDNNREMAEHRDLLDDSAEVVRLTEERLRYLNYAGRNGLELSDHELFLDLLESKLEEFRNQYTSHLNSVYLKDNLRKKMYKQQLVAVRCALCAIQEYRVSLDSSEATDSQRQIENLEKAIRSDIAVTYNRNTIQNPMNNRYTTVSSRVTELEEEIQKWMGVIGYYKILIATGEAAVLDASSSTGSTSSSDSTVCAIPAGMTLDHVYHLRQMAQEQILSMEAELRILNHFLDNKNFTKGQ